MGTEPGTNLHQHPAARAWNRLAKTSAPPDSMEMLKETKRSAVYRLLWTEPDRASVIAKRTVRSKGQIEQQSYAVLSTLTLDSVGYHGTAGDDDPLYTWLFIDDVGDERFRPGSEDHLRLAGAYLGTLYVSFNLEYVGNGLADRGPDFYRDHLLSLNEQLPAVKRAPALSPAGSELLDAADDLCRALSSKWDSLVEYCQSLPRTLIHGDCLPKNIHVRGAGGQRRAAFFDWGGAGIGLAGTDLGLLGLPHMGPPASRPDYEAYLQVVQPHWEAADLATVQELALIGQLFWALKVMDKSLPDLDYPSVHVVSNYRMYVAALRQSIEAAIWAR